MALIIEDGSIVAGADSYVSRAEYIAYALTQGVTIPDTDATDVTLRQCAAFIDEHEPTLKGDRKTRDQAMAFPRYGVYIDGFWWTDSEIPRQARYCQMQLALDVYAGVDIYNLPASASVPVKSERVEGAVSVEYAVSNQMKTSRNSSSRALLSQLLERSGLYSIPIIRA